jgi:hypothetical protein
MEEYVRKFSFSFRNFIGDNCCFFSSTINTMILPPVLYGYGTWSLTLKEEYLLRVLENRMLRRIFRPKKDEVTGGWRKLHNEEFRNLYSSSIIMRMIQSTRMRLAKHVARMARGEMYINIEGKQKE